MSAAVQHQPAWSPAAGVPEQHPTATAVNWPELAEGQIWLSCYANAGASSSSARGSTRPALSCCAPSTDRTRDSWHLPDSWTRRQQAEQQARELLELIYPIIRREHPNG